MSVSVCGYCRREPNTKEFKTRMTVEPNCRPECPNHMPRLLEFVLWEKRNEQIGEIRRKDFKSGLLNTEGMENYLAKPV